MHKDKLRTKASNKEYKDNWDNIFNKKKKTSSKKDDDTTTKKRSSTMDSLKRMMRSF